MLNKIDPTSDLMQRFVELEKELLAKAKECRDNGEFDKAGAFADCSTDIGCLIITFCKERLNIL